MRVLILCQYYRPEPIYKAVELAEELLRRGHLVYAITGVPHYPYGRLYPGSRMAVLRREVIEGVPVTRTFEYPYHGPSAIRRIFNYFSFAFSAPLGLLFVPKVDVMYVRHPPLTIGLAAWIIARMRRIPFVYDVEDIWPESAVISGVMRDGFVVKLMYLLEKFIYKRADCIVVVTEAAKANLVRKGVDPRKVHPMPKWVDDSLFVELDANVRPSIRNSRSWNEDFVVMFAGNLGYVQKLGTVLEAAKLLPPQSRIRIVFVGDGVDRERLEDLARREKLTDRVEFLGRQPQEAMGPLMAAADALLVHLGESELSQYVIPAKTLAYLAAAKPIVMAMSGAGADVVAVAEAGLVVPSESPRELVNAMCRLERMSEDERAAMGERGRAYLRANFAKIPVINQYEILIDQVRARR